MELFTPRKASRAIGRIEELLTQVVHLSSKAAEAEGAERARLLDASKHVLEEIEHVGCQVKSLEHGLIDFPAIRNGKQVFLCWKLGERKVTYWHTIESGFAGRNPILEGDFEEEPITLSLGRYMGLLEKVVEHGEEGSAVLASKVLSASQLDLPEIVLTDKEVRVLLRMISRYLDVCEESDVQHLHKLRRTLLEAVV
ncbi:MAG: DUF2203 family protein [Thaumarchaeota archaeon]|nr:DUF2203 family protein [Nitrososphaerota archaeon]